MIYFLSSVKVKKMQKTIFLKISLSFQKKFIILKNSFKHMMSEVILLIKNIPHLKTNNFPKACMELKSSICKIWGRC